MENGFLEEIKIVDFSNFMFLLIKFLIDLIVVYILTKLIYFKIRKNRTYLFSLFIVNIIIFFVCSILSSLTISLGFAFGIFAIFSILRYRTISIPIKEMTYFYLVISIAVINSLTNTGISLIEILFINAVIVSLTWTLEKIWIKNELMKNIIYEKIELIKKENHDKLLEDLTNRTGLMINRFEIGKIDFLRDIAQIRIYYSDSNGMDYLEDDVNDDDEIN